MAVIKGEMLVCDICKKSVFLKWIKHHVEPNCGGFGSYDIYENEPNGWGMSPCSLKDKNIKNLCPDCFKVLNDHDKQLKEEMKVIEKKFEIKINEAAERMKNKIHEMFKEE